MTRADVAGRSASLGHWQLFATPTTQLGTVKCDGSRLDKSLVSASANGTVAFIPLPGSELDKCGRSDSPAGL